MYDLPGAEAVEPLADAKDPASVLVVLSLTDVEREDAWVQIQPHCDIRGRDGITTSLREIDDDVLIARHFSILQAGESSEAAAQRVAAAFAGKGLAEICIVQEPLADMFREFQDQDPTRAAGAADGAASPTLQ